MKSRMYLKLYDYQVNFLTNLIEVTLTVQLFILVRNNIDAFKLLLSFLITTF